MSAKGLQSIIDRLSRLEVAVGWIDGNGTARQAKANLDYRNATGGLTPSLGAPVSQALIARTLNYGREAGMTLGGRKYPAIPARPFMDVAKEKFGAVYPRLLKACLPRVLSGAMGVEEFGKLVAVRVKDSVVEAIRDSGRYAPLSPATLKNRRHGGDTPLVDTGAMVNSVTFEVRFG